MLLRLPPATDSDELERLCQLHEERTAQAPSSNPQCAGDELLALLNAVADEQTAPKPAAKPSANRAAPVAPSTGKPPQSLDSKTKMPKSPSWGDSAAPSRQQVPLWTTVASRKPKSSARDTHQERDEWSSAKSSPALSSAGPGSPTADAKSTQSSPGFIGNRDKRSPQLGPSAQSADNTPKQRPRTPPREPQGRGHGSSKERRGDKRKGNRDKGGEPAEPMVPFNPQKSTINPKDEWWMYYDKPEGTGNMSQETFEVPRDPAIDSCGSLTCALAGRQDSMNLLGTFNNMAQFWERPQPDTARLFRGCNPH